MFKKILILFIFFNFLSFAALASSIRIGISSFPTNLGPFFSTDSNGQNINRLIHLSLLEFNSEMSFVCRACESFRESIIDGKHHIKFTLRKDLTFWDKSKIKNIDVKNAIEYFIEEEKIKSIFRFAFAKIKQVILIGEYDIELVYDSYSTENLSNLILLKILKFKNNDISDLTYKNIIGAGPYQIEEIKPLSVHLKSIDKKHEDLIFKVVRDETTMVLKLLRGEIDLTVADLEPSKISYLNNKEGIKFLEKSGTNYKYIGPNHHNWPLTEFNFRKALSLLIPRQEILINDLKEYAELSTGLFSKGFKGYYSTDNIDPYDPILAKKFIEEMGGKLIKNFYYFNGKPLKLIFMVPNSRSSIRLGRILKEYWEKGGIKIELVTLEWGTYLRNFKNGAYDLVLGQWVGFTGPDMLNFAFNSENIPPKGGNRGYYKNLEVDKLLNEIPVSKNEEDRLEIYRKVIKNTNQDYAYLNLWHPKVVWAMRKCLSDINLYPNGNFLSLLDLKSNCQRD